LTRMWTTLASRQRRETAFAEALRHPGLSALGKLVTPPFVDVAQKESTYWPSEYYEFIVPAASPGAVPGATPAPRLFWWPTGKRPCETMGWLGARSAAAAFSRMTRADEAVDCRRAAPCARMTLPRNDPVP
jgi:hypothetical protein